MSVCVRERARARLCLCVCASSKKFEGRSVRRGEKSAKIGRTKRDGRTNEFKGGGREEKRAESEGV